MVRTPGTNAMSQERPEPPIPLGKAYLYINAKAPQEVKDFVEEHFGEAERAKRCSA